MQLGGKKVKTKTGREAILCDLGSWGRDEMVEYEPGIVGRLGLGRGWFRVQRTIWHLTIYTTQSHRLIVGDPAKAPNSIQAFM